ANLGNAAQRIGRLTQDLSAAGTILSGEFRLLRAPMDLADLAAEIVALQQATTPDRDVFLDAPEHLEGEWDRDRIGQVLANLLSNAVKYSPRGTSVHVRVRSVGANAAVD